MNLPRLGKAKVARREPMVRPHPIHQAHRVVAAAVAAIALAAAIAAPVSADTHVIEQSYYNKPPMERVGPFTGTPDVTTTTACLISPENLAWGGYAYRVTYSTTTWSQSYHEVQQPTVYYHWEHDVTDTGQWVNRVKVIDRYGTDGFDRVHTDTYHSYSSSAAPCAANNARLVAAIKARIAALGPMIQYDYHRWHTARRHTVYERWHTRYLIHRAQRTYLRCLLTKIAAL